MSNKLAPGVEVSDTVLIAGGLTAVVLVIGVFWYIQNRVAAAGAAVGEAVGSTVDYIAHDAVNVTSDQNIANTAVNVLGQATGVFGTNDLTGEPNTLGSALYELFN